MNLANEKEIFFDTNHAHLYLLWNVYETAPFDQQMRSGQKSVRVGPEEVAVSYGKVLMRLFERLPDNTGPLLLEHRYTSFTRRRSLLSLEKRDDCNPFMKESERFAR